MLQTFSPSNLHFLTAVCIACDLLAVFFVLSIVLMPLSQQKVKELTR